MWKNDRLSSLKKPKALGFPKAFVHFNCFVAISRQDAL
ncbi:hypothetical protein X808_1760 [Mannheimia varigena USDA-ARS-USMARC-1296]|uniref:Uncharacterized protein n=1 Tax=Mannheimia varigena USDA-ARS-USMARC-1296 TaxID=1433287 RepID=W0QBW9_9PAST|nr:hypothetical protein X808_1760 [Mannheimia varigena USDA-ARS-USMARC-1296]